MPPQMNEALRCRFSEKTRDDLPDFLMKDHALDSSIDTVSTCSTDVETALSKESLSSECFDEIESPCSIRHRGAVFTYDFDEESSKNSLGHDGAVSYEHSSKYSHKGLRERLILRRRLLVLGISMLVLSAVFLWPTLKEAGEYLKWKSFLENDSPKIMKEIRRTPTGSTFTIRLKGGRIDLLKQSLDAHSKCSSVDEIQIELDENKPVPQVLFQYGAGKATQAGPLTTTGVFLVSEGIQFSCEDLDNAFNTWKKDPRRFVGFLGSQPSNSSDIEAISSLHESHQTYTVLSDRAAFIHRRYLDAFAPFAKGSCCENLLSVQVSIASKKPPVLMKADPRNIIAPVQPLWLQAVSLDSQQRSCSENCTSYLARFLGLQTLPNADTSVLFGWL